MSENMEQAKFEGWAMVEMMGHQSEVGYVTTEYFGGAALFRVDVPEIAEREIKLERPEYIDGRMVPEGSTVKRGSAPGRTRFISPSALYAMNPCTEEAARKAVEKTTLRKIAVVSLNQPALGVGTQADDVCFSCGAPIDLCECPDDDRDEEQL